MSDAKEQIARELAEQFALMCAEAQSHPDPSIPCVAPWSFETRILAALTRVEQAQILKCAEDTPKLILAAEQAAAEQAREQEREPLLSGIRETLSALQASVEAHTQRCKYSLAHDHTGYREVKVALGMLQEAHDAALLRARTTGKE